MKKDRLFAILFVLSLIFNLIAGYYIVTLSYQINYMKDILNEVIQYNDQLMKENEKLRNENLVLKRTIEILNRTTYYSYNVSYEGAEWINIVGVYMVRKGFFESELKGVVMKAYAKIVPGSGRVFIATTPKIGIDLQKSVETAFNVAKRIAGINNSIDLQLIIVANKSINVVDGPSAGAAITVLIISMLLNKSINRDVFMTGTINIDGSIGPVGGIFEKALIAAKNNATIFLVPRGQSKVIKMVKKEEKHGFVTIIHYTSVEVDLEEELRKMGYNITVIEVDNIMQALNYFLHK